MKAVAIVVCIAILASPIFAMEADLGSVFVAAFKPEYGPVAREAYCDADKRSFRIDAMQTSPWPNVKSVKFEGLDVTRDHLVAIFCKGKLQQSFRFRFSRYQTSELCLFLGGYQTAQLAETKRVPWCKCN